MVLLLVRRREVHPPTDDQRRRRRRRRKKVFVCEREGVMQAATKMETVGDSPNEKEAVPYFFDCF